MPSFLSLCLALLRLAIRTTTRVQGLLIDLHNTVEWVIEQQGHPSRIPSTNEQSTSRSLTLPHSANTIDVVSSDHMTPSKSLSASVSEDVPSISAIEAFRSQILPSTRAVSIISSNNEVFKTADVQSAFYKSENTDKFGRPAVPEDEDKVKEIEVTLKLYSKEPISEPVLSVLCRREDNMLDSEDHSGTAISGIIRQNNEQSVVLQSKISNSGTSVEDSHILKSNESKWREYRMMLKWYRDETVVPIPNKDGLDYEQSTEQEPLDLSTNSENIGDAIDHEESNEPHFNISPKLLETTKDEDVCMPIVSNSSPYKLTTPTKVGIAMTSSQLTTSSPSTTDREVQSNIQKLITNQASIESAKSKDLRHKREESKNTSSLASSESVCSSKIRVPSEEMETDVSLEVKALPESLIMSEPWLVTHKSTYDIDLKFEKNLHLKEYDISTIREKGTSKFSKSPIRNSLTGKKHDIEPTKKTQSHVRHSSSDRKKSGTVPIKTNKYTVSPSLAVAFSQSLSLPQFCVDSSTGNVQWKSDKPGKDVSSESKSPYKQSSKSPITKTATPKSGTIAEASIQNRNIPTEMMKPRNVYEPNVETSASETTTSEEEVQFKPIRERQPTPPPPRFPYVISSTDSEKIDSEAVDSEFKPTRERRPTPAARFPTIEFSADIFEKAEDRKIEGSYVLRPNEASVVEEPEFKSIGERRVDPAAKFVDHDSTPSDNERDNISSFSISVPRETPKFKENSPFKSQQKLHRTEVGLIKKLSPKRIIVADAYPEQFYPSQNQFIGTDENREFDFKPVRERRPTPAARFPTPETTDSEYAGENSTQPQHAPESWNTESSTNEPEPNPTCKRISSSVPGISGSPTGKDVSIVSKLAPRLRTKSSTSPRSSGKSREAKTSPTVKFRIPESQAKRENTGTIRKESKLPLRKSAKELSTSEEEYESNLSYKRKASPAKYPFIKSARMLADATAASRSLDFSPRKMSSENKVETRSLCEVNTSAKSENTHSESVPGETLLRELLTRSDVQFSEPKSSTYYQMVLPKSQTSASDNNINGNEMDSHSTFGGDSATKGEIHPYPHPSRAPHNSPNIIKDSSTEMSASESTTGTTTSNEQEEDSALEGETDVPTQPEDSRSYSDLENERFLRRFGIRFHYQGSTTSDSTTTESSIGYGSGGDSTPEGIAGLFPRGTPEIEIIAESVDASIKDCPHPETNNCKPLTNVDQIDDAVETDYTSSKSLTETMHVEDSAPEGTESLLPQLSDNEPLIIAENVAYDSSGSDSTSKSSRSEKSPSNSCREDSASENYKSVTNAENVDINEVCNSSSKSSPTVMESSHELENSELEGTEGLFLHLKNIESSVNLEGNKDCLRAETHSLLTESSSDTSTEDNFARGTLESKENDSQKAMNESPGATLSENTRKEMDSTSSESLKHHGSGDEYAYEGVETILEPSTKEFRIVPRHIEISRNTSSKMDCLLSEAKSSETSNSDMHLGDCSRHKEVSDLEELPEISKSSISSEKSKDKPGAETDSLSLEPPSSDKFIGVSSKDSEFIKESGQYSSETKELSNNSDDSDDTSSETDSKSTESTPSEKSSSDEYGDYSATGGATDFIMEQETSKSPTNAGEESKDEFNVETDSASSGLTQSDTSTNKRFEGNFVNTTDNSPQVETSKPPTDSRIPNIAETDFTLLDSAQSKISDIENSKVVSFTESPGNKSPIETCESFSANYPDIRTEFEHAFLVIKESICDISQLEIGESVGTKFQDVRTEFNQADLVVKEPTGDNSQLETCDFDSANYPGVRTELEQGYLAVEESTKTNYPDVRSEFDQADLVVRESTSDNSHVETDESVGANYPDVHSELGQVYLVVEVPSTDAESISPERLSPIYEVSTNGAVSDVTSDYENGYVVSSPSESSSEGEFILQQDGPCSPPICISPKNGDSSSEAEAMFHEVTSDRNEYSHPIEPMAESSPRPPSPICESPTKENVTGKNSDSDTLSSMSSPSKSSNSEEERNNVHVKIEVNSGPNTNKSETCDVSTLSLYPESDNIEDKYIKDSLVCLQANECLKMTNYGENVSPRLFETIQKLTDYNILLLETLTQAQSQIIDSDYNCNSVAASVSISKTKENNLYNVSVDSNNTDEDVVIQTTQTQSVIPDASTSMEIENSLVSEQNSPTELSDTMVSEKETRRSVLAPVYSSALQESSTEIELDNIIDVSQAELCSIRESVVTEKVIEDSPSGREDVCDNTTITEELNTSQLLASDISILVCERDGEKSELVIPIETSKPLMVLGVTDETNIDIDNKEQISQSQSRLVSNTNDKIEIANSSVLFQSLLHHSKANETTANDATDLEVLSEEFNCIDKNDGLTKGCNELASESLTENVLSNADKSQIYDYSIETRLIGYEKPNIADNTEIEISMPSELPICKELPLECPTKSDGVLDFERIASPLTLKVNASNIVGQVDTENGFIVTESFGDELINTDSTKYGNDIVSTRSLGFETSIELSAKTKDDPNSALSSENLVDKPQTNLGYTEINFSASDETIALETSIKNVFIIMQNETENIPVASNLIDLVSIRSDTSICESSTSVTGEEVDGLDIKTPASSEALVCIIPTSEDAELGSDSEITIESDLITLQDESKKKFEMEIEHVSLKSTISDLTVCVNRTETLVDDSVGKSELIICEISTDVPGKRVDCCDSRNTFEPESTISDDSIIASSNKMRNNLDSEEKLDSESLAIEVSLGENISEFKDSNLPLTIFGGIKSENDAVSNDSDSLNNIVTEIIICDSSNDYAEHIKSDDGTKFEVYIAPEPVTFDIALGSTLKVLPSEIPIDYPLVTDHINKNLNPTPLATEFESCGRSVGTKHEGDNGQDVRTNFTSESVICDTQNNADSVDEISISKPSVAVMTRDNLTRADEPTTDANLNISEPVVSETIICEVSKDCDDSVQESTSTTSSLKIEGSFDYAQNAENVSNDVEEDSGTNVENKAWKKKSRKSKKKRKH